MDAKPRKDLMYEDDGDYMLIPEEFALKLVGALLSDLSEERRAVITATIEEWGDEWGNLGR